MAYRFFQIPARGCPHTEDEINKLLRAHKVFSVQREWVALGTESYWAICVDFNERPSGVSRDSTPVESHRGKTDYKLLLNEEDFAIFAKLRDWRKAIAQQEAIPVYTVFTNEQLAQFVRGRVKSKADVENVAGVGEARVQKYGERLLEFLTPFWKEPSNASTDGQSP